MARTIRRREDYLKQHSEGRSLEEIFAAVVTSREYAAYQPVNRDQIRQWLSWGYTPQDIINADSIARAKDMQMGGVPGDEDRLHQVGGHRRQPGVRV